MGDLSIVLSTLMTVIIQATLLYIPTYNYP